MMRGREFLWMARDECSGSRRLAIVAISQSRCMLVIIYLLRRRRRLLSYGCPPSTIHRMYDGPSTPPATSDVALPLSSPRSTSARSTTFHSPYPLEKMVMIMNISPPKGKIRRASI